MGERGDKGGSWRTGRTGSPGRGESPHNATPRKHSRLRKPRSQRWGGRRSGRPHELSQVVKGPGQAEGAARLCTCRSHGVFKPKGHRTRPFQGGFLNDFTLVNISRCGMTAVHRLSVSGLPAGECSSSNCPTPSSQRAAAARGFLSSGYYLKVIRAKKQISRFKITQA